MPKVGMEDVRRRQLIDATIASIHEDGFGATTIARISKRAGLSGGIVAHYFNDKAGLLEATWRSIAEDLRVETVRRLKDARTPEERLLAVIDANFAPSQFVPEVVSVWLTYWALVPQTPTLKRVHAINERRMISNFQHALKPHLPEDQVKAVATGLAALIEGLWLRCALSSGGVTPEEAAAIARDYAKDQFKKHAAGIAPPLKDRQPAASSGA